MIVSVIVDDFVDRRQSGYVIQQADLIRLQEHWTTPDTMLISLQSNPFFTGRTAWADLSIAHWQIMLSESFKLLASLEDADRDDKNNGIVKSFAFLLSGIITALQNSVGCILTLLRMFRIDEDEITYDFTASLPFTQIPPPDAPEQGGFKIVVDNT